MLALPLPGPSVVTADADEVTDVTVVVIVKHS